MKKNVETNNKVASKIKTIVLEEDFYALTWVALRENTWKGKKLMGNDIFLVSTDYFWIHLNFLLFIFLLLITIILIILEVIEERKYIASNLTIVVLRITLISFAQKALSPEFFQGLFLLRFSIRYPSFFSYSNFAIFIGFCQFFVACIVFCSIILFVCMEDEALTLVVEFAGLTVIANLDNWIGEVIMHSKCYNDEKIEILDDSDINYNLTLYQKIALIEEEDLVLIDDQNYLVDTIWVVNAIEYIIDFLPWQYILPFITIIFNYVLPILSQK